MKEKRKFSNDYLVLILLILLLIVNYTIVNNRLRANVNNRDYSSHNKKIVLSKEEAIKRAVRKIGPTVVTIKQSDELSSGIIFSSQGYILTSYEVVKGEEKIIVKLANEQQFTAQLIGKDRQSNLAVIKIENQNLPVADFGNSNKVKIGHLAIAIGSPFNLEFKNTVTSGVISATNRQIEVANNYHDPELLDGLIQTDASINPGNRGGPLLNSQGEVIGINIDNTHGMGFSIPINKVKRIVKDLMEEGTVKRPWIGIYGTKLTSEITDYYELPLKDGVMVFRVIIDSPAEQAGLEKGDVIVEANHKEVTNMKELNNIIRQQIIGSNLKLLVRKKSGNWRVITAKIIKMPSKNIN